MKKDEGRLDQNASEDRETLVNQESAQTDETTVGDSAIPIEDAPEDVPTYDGIGDSEGAKDRTNMDSVELPDLAAEVALLQDQLLRKQADFENFRRRLHRDKDEAIRYANAEVLLDLAEVIDGLERAVQTDTEADAVSLRDGVSLIEKQLTGMLERKWGFCRFSSEGEAFDPDKHQAIASEESEEHKIATVVEDYQKGYMLHDRVVRPARVKVAQPIAEGDGSSEHAEDAESAHRKEGT